MKRKMTRNEGTDSLTNKYLVYIVGYYTPDLPALATF